MTCRKLPLPAPGERVGVGVGTTLGSAYSCAAWLVIGFGRGKQFKALSLIDETPHAYHFFITDFHNSPAKWHVCGEGI